MARTSPTFRRRQLARRIRQLREQAGFTQHRAAADLDMSTSALSRKEIGDSVTSVHEVRSMMDLYDAYDPDLLDLARAAKEKGWWRAYGIEDRGYVDLETEACAVRELSLMYVPGLLQTEDYMRAVLGADRWRRSERDLENDAAVRLIRQRRLTDLARPLRLSAVVDEAALRKPVGGRDVMRDQLNYMARQVESEGVELRMLTTASAPHAGMDGAFIVLTFPDALDRDVLYVAYPTGSIHVEKEVKVRAATVAFEHLRALALPGHASVELIETAAREL